MSTERINEMVIEIQEMLSRPDCWGKTHRNMAMSIVQYVAGKLRLPDTVKHLDGRKQGQIIGETMFKEI